MSERDIVRALAERGSSALEEPVGQVMTRKVLACSETDRVGEIMERMAADFLPTVMARGFPAGPVVGNVGEAVAGARISGFT